MVIGGMASIFKVRKGLVDAIKVLRKTQVGPSQKNIPLNERNIPAKAINMFSAIAIILVGGVYFYITNGEIFSPVIIFSLSTMPVIMPTRSCSPGRYVSGISAVSPPTSETPVSLHA